MQPEIAPSDIKFDEYRPNASAEILNIRNDESNQLVPSNLVDRNVLQQNTPMSYLNSGRMKSHRSNGQLPQSVNYISSNKSIPMMPSSGQQQFADIQDLITPPTFQHQHPQQQPMSQPTPTFYPSSSQPQNSVDPFSRPGADITA